MVFSRIQLKGKVPKVLRPKFQKAVKQQNTNESICQSIHPSVYLYYHFLRIGLLLFSGFLDEVKV